MTAERLAAHRRRRGACRSSTSRPTTRPTARRSTATAGPGWSEGLRILRQGARDGGRARALRRPPGRARSSRPPRCSTCCRSRRSCAGRRISSWRRRATGKPVNVKKGQFVAPAGHEERRGQDPVHRQRGHPAHRARHDVRLQQSRGGHARARRHACARLSGRLRRHALGAAARRRRATARAASASTCRPWRGRRWPSAWTRSSWRCTRIPIARCPTAAPLSDGPNMLRIDDLPRLLGRDRRHPRGAVTP